MLLRLYGLLVLLALSGCGDKPSQTLVFGAVTWPGYEPAYVARELGFLDENRIHLAEFTNATEVLRAFRNGQLHIAGLTLDEALSLRQNIPDLQVFLVADVSHGADVLMVRRNIRKLAELKGKRIGVEKTALGAYFLSLILRAAALTDKDVQIVSLPLDEHVDAYRRGLVDAVVSFGLVRDKLAQMGAVVLFDSSKVPGKIVDTLVVRAAVADRHGENLRAFVGAWFRALRVIQNEPARAYPLMAQHEQAPEKEVDEIMRGLVLLDQRQNRQQLSGDHPVLFETAMEIQKILRENGLAVGGDDLSQFVNPRIVAESAFD